MHYADCLKNLKRFDESKIIYSKIILKNPSLKPAYLNWLSMIEENNILDNSDITCKIILNIIKSKDIIRPRKISGLILALIKSKINFSDLIEAYTSKKITLQELIIILTKQELFIEFICICPISDILVEQFLRFLRFEILINYKNFEFNKEIEMIQIAISHQLHINEYLYIENEIEKSFIKEIEEKNKKLVLSNIKPNLKEILCLSMYKSIYNFDWFSFSFFKKELKKIHKRQFSDLEEENKIKLSIPVFTSIVDTTSLKIREQYEESPYPRWYNLSLPSNSKSLSTHFIEYNLRSNFNNILENKKLDILVAGCGTGQHPIEVSRTFENCKILAIDLSLNSLAYAIRITNEFKILNINYAQADILNLSQLSQFDIIDCVGVLHHMDDPIVGFKCLMNKLNPKGFMRIGLYSKLARRNIYKIQNEISTEKIKTEILEIKKFREKLINSEELHHKSLLSKNDFYSTSELRDLLFNFKEHKFNLLDLKFLLEKLNLYFCGFENNDLINKFKKRYNNKSDIFDLDLWNEFENIYPNSFSNMYVFWCQKN